MEAEVFLNMEAEVFLNEVLASPRHVPIHIAQLGGAGGSMILGRWKEKKVLIVQRIRQIGVRRIL